MSVSAAQRDTPAPPASAEVARTRRLAVVAARSTTVADGIRDYTLCLLSELEAREGWDVHLALRALGGGWEDPPGAPATRAMPSSVRRADAVLLQYNPFSFGRRGFAPRLLVELTRLRLTRRRPLVAVVVHETFVDMKNWRWALMGAWQRLQLRAVRALSDVQLCATDAWLRRVGGAAVHHVPVGSNFPDRREHREEERRRLGVSDDTLVLACFGLRDPGRMGALVIHSAEAVARAGRPVLVLNLGSGPGEETEGPLRVHTPGFLDDDSVARLLSTVDVFLAPYEDGVSTRRTTVMAALQHELAVVGTDGPFTDGILRDAGHALRLVPPDRFADAVAELAASAEDRRTLGLRGRELYESHFAWPVIADRVLEILARARARS
jgi:glycosyltransferase involved in cell wall biosynthesis